MNTDFYKSNYSDFGRAVIESRADFERCSANAVRELELAIKEGLVVKDLYNTIANILSFWGRKFGPGFVKEMRDNLYKRVNTYTSTGG